MNNVVLIGRLTKDPDVRVVKNSNVARFMLAVDRRYNGSGEQSAEFISCVAFGKTAEFMEKYIKKGMKIALEGRITTGSYTNKDGQKVYTTDVVAYSIEFCESKMPFGG